MNKNEQEGTNTVESIKNWMYVAYLLVQDFIERTILGRSESNSALEDIFDYVPPTTLQDVPNPATFGDVSNDD